jgi:hypothetical protein
LFFKASEGKAHNLIMFWGISVKVLLDGSIPESTGGGYGSSACREMVSLE